MEDTNSVDIQNPYDSDVNPEPQKLILGKRTKENQSSTKRSSKKRQKQSEESIEQLSEVDKLVKKGIEVVNPKISGMCLNICVKTIKFLLVTTSEVLDKGFLN